MKRSVRAFVTAALIGSLLVAGLIQPASAATVVRVTQTWKFRPTSPDPTGLTYDPGTRRLLISDSEVDETRWWRGRNLWITGLGGRQFAARTLKLTATKEPEDLAWDNRRRVLYVTDDDRHVVLRFTSGRDRRFGTRDDGVGTVLRTLRFGSTDPEGLAWWGAGPLLIVTDQTTDRVYKVRRGRDRRFGTRDDTVSSFSTRNLAPNADLTNPEDVVVSSRRGNLMIVSSQDEFIVETTMRGAFIRKIDVNDPRVRVGFTGIAIAPASRGRGRHVYVTDIGSMNTGNPADNDGRLFELRL